MENSSSKDSVFKMDAELNESESNILLSYLGQKTNQLFKSSNELVHLADLQGVKLLNRYWVIIFLVASICFQFVALIDPVSKEEFQVNLLYMLNSFIMIVLMFCFYKYDNEIALQIASFLNISRQAIRLWDFE